MVALGNIAHGIYKIYLSIHVCVCVCLCLKIFPKVFKLMNVGWAKRLINSLTDKIKTLKNNFYSSPFTSDSCHGFTEIFSNHVGTQLDQGQLKLPEIFMSHCVRITGYPWNTSLLHCFTHVQIQVDQQVYIFKNAVKNKQPYFVRGETANYFGPFDLKSDKRN